MKRASMRAALTTIPGNMRCIMLRNYPLAIGLGLEFALAFL